jgi:Fur family transcriptional regulator, iron response regulator
MSLTYKGDNEHAPLQLTGKMSQISEPSTTATDERVSGLLRKAGLRPTRQRLVIGRLLFAGDDRHVSAEILHAEAVRAGERVSLATVYNALHQLKQVGLLRELAIDGQRTYFDTNVSNHNHFYNEASGDVFDIPADQIRVAGLPVPPEGMKIAHIDVIVRLVKA